MAGEHIRSLCNSCGRETDHLVDWQHAIQQRQDDDSVIEKRHITAHCAGCQETSKRIETWMGTGNVFDFIEVDFQPARIWRRPPTWLASLEETDPTLVGLLNEVYSATNDSQIRLLSMGVRASLDHTMTSILGADAGSFEEKLDRMAEGGHLTNRQKENIAIVIDAGSASSHRGFRPPRELVEEMVVVMESIIRDHYVTGPMLATAKTLIPPRPPRQPRQPKNGEAG